MTIVPFEQLLAEAATLAGIKINATPAQEYGRAQAALKVAAVLTDYGQGNVSSIPAALEALAGSLKDPAEAQFVQDALQVGANVYNLLSLLPNALAEGLAAQAGAGMTVVASKVQPPTVSPQQAPSPSSSASSQHAALPQSGASGS